MRQSTQKNAVSQLPTIFRTLFISLKKTKMDVLAYVLHPDS